MSTAQPYESGHLDAGKHCPHCQRAIAVGELIYKCDACDSLHHESCWRANQGCASYYCGAATRVDVRSDEEPNIVITLKDTENVVPEAPASFSDATHGIRQVFHGKRSSRLAIASLVLAVAGIPLAGCITGIASVVLGCFALGAIANNSTLKGGALAGLGVGLGIVDAVLWVAVFAFFVVERKPSIEDSARFPTPEALESAPVEIRNVMMANVFILGGAGEKRSRLKLGSYWVGSGVIVDIKDNAIRILTNRHVLDPGFEEVAPTPLKECQVQVFLCTGERTSGQLESVGPDGIDIGILKCAIKDPQKVTAVAIDATAQPSIGDEVFAVGNPQELSWTYTKGVISSIRSKQIGKTAIKVIQTRTPTNPGSSGLYAKDGRLIGINTWTVEKSTSEGLSFAISAETISKTMELRSAQMN